MRVLVTGHLGYIGSVLTSVLRHARFEVVGLDCDWYRGCDFGRVKSPVPSFDIDVRDVEFTDLLSFDAVVHLAGLSDDAAADLDGDLTDSINHAATVRLAECCKRAGVSRFVFASSCSVYGRRGGALLDETAEPRPLTRYARSKVRCEQDLARLADDHFAPVFLRNATAYGVSPRLRADLVVNDFVASAVVSDQVVLKTNGASFRPLVHVEDIARACAAVLSAPEEQVRSQIFNIVPPGENHRVIDIADAVAELLPHCTRSAPAHGFDQRSYCADGLKFLRTFPRFSFRWTLPLGIRQLHLALRAAGLTPGDFRSDRYRRVLRLQSLLEHGQVDAQLRRPSYAIA